MQYIEDSELNGEVTATQPEATPAATDKPAITTGEAGTSTEAPEGGEEQIPKSSVQVMSTKNQFNSSERATQTTNNPKRDRAANTEPPPQKLFSGAVYQWSIFDAYTEDIASKERIAKEKAKVLPNRTLIISILNFPRLLHKQIRRTPSAPPYQLQLITLPNQLIPCQRLQRYYPECLHSTRMRISSWTMLISKIVAMLSETTEGLFCLYGSSLRLVKV